MRSVRCYDCGRVYDYDEDGFCPRCGAFNQPRRTVRIGADGVVREDGINEVNHANSFVHRELHEEKRERRRLGLDKSVRRVQQVRQSPRFQQQAASQALLGRPSRKSARNQTGNPVTLVVWVIIVIVFLNILSRIAMLF